MTRKRDYKLISLNECEILGCDWEAYAIATKKFLCEFHFREIKPSKEGRDRVTTGKGFVGKGEN